MYCPNCGTQMPEGSAFCTGCGTSLPQIQDVKPLRLTEVRQLEYGGMPMKWYKFNIYFRLWVSAALLLYNGISMATGVVYEAAGNGMSAAFVYGYYGNGLRVLDILYGLLALALAAGLVYTRFRLAKFRANAVKCYFAVLAVNIILLIVYLIGVWAVTGIAPWADISNISNIAGAGIMLCIELAYYKKRKHLFVN